MVRRVAIVGAGAGGAAAAVELTRAGLEVALWARSPATLAPFAGQDGIAHEGVFGGGMVRPRCLAAAIVEALDGADAILVCLPTYAHGEIARLLAAQPGTGQLPVVLNPGHTGGALEFRHAFRSMGVPPPPIAEFSTLTYVARKYRPGCVTITGRAKSVRLAGLPGGAAAVEAGRALYPAARVMPDVLACDLANVNMVLHPPGAVLGAAWIEARRGDFTFYVDGMTPGVARVMAALDRERCEVARALGHELPPLVAEMQAIGTVEAETREAADVAAAIASGEANRRIKAPDALTHRYYREDFGHGLLPFIAMAEIAGVAVPVAAALLKLGETLLAADFSAEGRSAARMGIAGLDRNGLLNLVQGRNRDG